MTPAPTTTRWLRYAAGIALLLAIAPGSARAQCSHPPNSFAKPDFGGSFGEHLTFYSTSSEPKQEEWLGTADNPPPAPKPPAKPKPCRDCFRCGGNPFGTPTSTSSSVRLLDILHGTAFAIDLHLAADHVGLAAFCYELLPVSSIDQPPKF